jgi:hypothetical protein
VWAARRQLRDWVPVRGHWDGKRRREITVGDMVAGLHSVVLASPDDVGRSVRRSCCTRTARACGSRASGEARHATARGSPRLPRHASTKVTMAV